MIDFEFHRPTTLEETCDLLETYGDDARIMAGGTALVLMMKQRLSQPGHIVSLLKLPGLDFIAETNHAHGGAIQMGTLCTQRQVETSPLINEKLPLVAETFRSIATPRIRSMATVGGGLVHGDLNQDPPPTLIALDASVVLTSSGGQRVMPVEELFLDYYETDLQPGGDSDQRSDTAAVARLRDRLCKVPAPHRRRLRHGIGSHGGHCR